MSGRVVLPQWMTGGPELDILPIPAQAPPPSRRRRRKRVGHHGYRAECTVPLCGEPWAVLVYARGTGELMGMICAAHGREL